MNKKRIITVFIHAAIYLCISRALFSQGNTGDPVKKTEPDFTQIKNYCVECHNELAGKLKEPVRLWRVSVHGKAGTKCNICHGGNPDSNIKTVAKSKASGFIGIPKFREMLLFCGREGCHVTEHQLFMKGPHYKSVVETGVPNCSSCHGTHNIQKSSSEIITDKNCATGCHTPEHTRKILTSLTGIEKGVKNIYGNINFLQEYHSEIKEIESRLQRTRLLYRQFMHIFSLTEIQTTQKIIELEIENLLHDTGTKVDLTQRLNILYIMTIIFAALTISGFLIYTAVMLYRRK